MVIHRKHYSLHNICGRRVDVGRPKAVAHVRQLRLKPVVAYFFDKHNERRLLLRLLRGAVTRRESPHAVETANFSNNTC